ncbi:branched-chain amino acid ABC transporter permease [Bradyrhizobium sp. DOA9]|uniref:branched-chain amino acid ABC transporter permease n=1 Tax=Bradyrhizobium sp. DOA9 TaxID=1126627 RepID=UPI0004998CCE|nr:branched-chain amino acid ABC transporter permease [Bradyrhizobium sp. DOA9]GAJ37553.1 high-affinity branched-chain amino acid transport system permease protein LivM [Bradyrhizobium sp. DOA9]
MSTIAKEAHTASHQSTSGVSRHRRDWAAFAVIVGILWCLPLSLGGFYLYLGLAVAIYAISALGLQIMVGLAGQLSLGHAAFMGIGAYTSVLLQKNAGVPFPAALAAAALAAAAAGLLMAQLIRLSGVYFKIATFGFGVVVHQILSNWTALTGGSAGVRAIPAIGVLGFQIETRTGLFVCEALTLTLLYALLIRLSHGKIGRAFRALGQNEAAARSVGIAVARYRMMVITLGCAIAGIAGAYLPHLMRFLSPESFTWYESLTCLIMITLGGLGSLPGAIIGAAILIVAPEYLRDFAQYKMFAFGILLVASMILLPRGIAGAGMSLSRGKRMHAQ